ncbi:D-alanyl-D-alanine carboxypeptidase [Streptomyces gobiensis]|nr:D-alanyl-D-alanine carboxypeptidase [Streptomyces gobiensis]UGY95183.1 D-alanyl-D-alanine carboxypeptidase [Streptomyces gobiensis]
MPALLAGAVPAYAKDTDEAKPPAKMSTVGGERLGRPGTQIEPIDGAKAPKVPKGLTARSWIVADAESGEVLAARNAHWRLPPASTIKMLFADTLLPKLSKDMEHTILPEDLAGLGEGSSSVGVKEDYTYKVDDLWNGVFLRSGNDAVFALAALNGGVTKTVREMNARAKELGAGDTHVVSPDGYDAKGQHSSAYDLTLIARSGMQNPDFRRYASTVRAKFPGGYKDEEEKKKREYFELQTTNRLLIGDYGLEPYEGLAGIKNGYTSKAGFTFTGVAQRGDRKLLVTVMHPDSGRNRVYQETAKLLDWGFKAAGKVQPVGELVPPVTEQEAVKAGNGKNSDGDKDAVDNTAVGGEQGSGGFGIALGIAGATLVVLGAAAFAVNRRWPLPIAITRGAPQRSRPPEERG